MKLVHLLLVACAWAFADTAPFAASVRVPGDFGYVTEAPVLAAALQDFTEQACAAGQSIALYRVRGTVPRDALYIPHVHYSSHEIAEPSCVHVYDVDEVPALDADIVLVRGIPSFSEKRDIFAQVEADLARAKAMAAAEGGTVSIYSNLFTKYQFFTPGVWMALLVLAFLLFVVATAVLWIALIDISYRAFDKQVDYEKKTE